MLGNRFTVTIPPSLREKAMEKMVADNQALCKGMYHPKNNCNHKGGTRSLGPIFGKWSTWTAKAEGQYREQSRKLDEAPREVVEVTA